MKETVKISRIAGQFEKMYRELNTDFFEGKLETPVITIQSTPRAYGHVSCAKIWEQKDGIKKYELNIGADDIGRKIENVVATLLHEMVHIYHLQNGIQDTSRGNSYHNKKFKEKAESVGLVIGYNSRIGFSITSPSDDLILYIAEKGWNDILINRGAVIERDNTSGTIEKTGIKKPSSTRKYKCPCCGNSVRATKEINIKCGDCEKQMIPA